MDYRINSLDILRAFAIICMIQVHVFYFWTNNNYGFVNLIIIFFGNLAAPFFLIVSGSSFFLFICKKKETNISKLEIFKDVLIRAIFIFIVTLLFQLLFGFILGIHISFIIYWSIFQVITFSMILYFFLPFLKRNIRLIIITSLFFLIYLLYYLIKFFSIKYISILISGGEFTFLPWTSFFIFGILIGDLIINTSYNYLKTLFKIFFLIGIIILFFWWFIIKELPLEMYVITFLAAFSVFFIFFPLNYYLIDIKKLQSQFASRLIHWGRFSFSIYYIQFTIIAVGVLVFPFIIPDLFSKGFLIYQFLIIITMFYIGIDLFLKIWKKVNYIFSIEWFLNLINKKTLFSKP